MAGNFTKAQALALIDQTAAPAGRYLFGDEQKNEVMTFSKDRSYAAAYGSGLPVKTFSQGSITYTLNGGQMSSKKKTQTGVSSANNANTGFIQKTVYLSEPYTIEDEFRETDLISGIKNAVAVKFAQALNAFDDEYEEGFITAIIENKQKGAAAAHKLEIVKGLTTGVDAIVNADTARIAKNVIVEAAFELAELKDDTYAINGIKEDRIFIDMSSKLFNRLVDERLISDAADATFGQGIFRIGQMGGFKVRRNEYLGKAIAITQGTAATEAKAKAGTSGVVHAVIATDVTAVGPRQLIAANSGLKGDLSNDKGYYVEQKFASADGTSKDYAVIGVEPLLRLIIDGEVQAGDHA